MAQWTPTEAAVNLRAVIQAEYREMPCLKLSLPQAQRLWALERAQCQQILDDLVNVGFLRLTRDGSYMRSSP